MVGCTVLIHRRVGPGFICIKKQRVSHTRDRKGKERREGGEGEEDRSGQEQNRGRCSALLVEEKGEKADGVSQ